MTLANNEPFVPLAVGSPSRKNSDIFQVLVAARPENAKTLAEAQATAQPDPKHLGSPCEPRVTLEKEGNRITAIHIHCSCGQQIDLNCSYAPCEAV